MRLLLEQSEIEAALEAFVRTQITVPENQIITVRPTLGESGALEASVYLNATSAPIPAPKSVLVHRAADVVPQAVAAPASRKPRAVKAEPTVATHIAARVAEDQALADEPDADPEREPVAATPDLTDITDLTNQADAIINDEPLPNITATPEDREPEPAPTAAAAKPFSLFSKPEAAAPVEEAAPAPVAKVNVMFGAKNAAPAAVEPGEAAPVAVAAKKPSIFGGFPKASAEA